jgi:hypothetical protein
MELAKGSFAEAEGDQEEELQATFGRLDEKIRLAILAALSRLLHGQTAEDCYTELFIELGDSPALARKNVRKALVITTKEGAIC